jgi:hypothetical protein
MSIHSVSIVFTCQKITLILDVLLLPTIELFYGNLVQYSGDSYSQHTCPVNVYKCIVM